MRRYLPKIVLAMTILMALGPLIIFPAFNIEFDGEDDPNYLVPAGYSFAIWYVIYAGFILLGFYQAQRSRLNDQRFVKIRIFIIINAIANNLWLLCLAMGVQILPFVFNLIVLLTLIPMTKSLELGKPGKDLKERLIVKLPLAMYLGWMTLLTPISITYVLMETAGLRRIPFLNSEIWTVILLLGSILVVIYLLLKRRVDLTYLLVVIWGLVAIFVGNVGRSQNVAFSAFGLAVGLLITYIIIERQQMEYNKMQTELTALRNQVNPHFLFNNLNTLANLIPVESKNAHNYLEKLASFYRYVVNQGDGHLITLGKELEGVEHYFGILKERFGELLTFEVNCGEIQNKEVVPLCLQLLVENAVKHNSITETHPLEVRIYPSDAHDYLHIENSINERIHILDSSGIGLKNILKRYRFHTKRKVIIHEDEKLFRVSLPLISH